MSRILARVSLLLFLAVFTLAIGGAGVALFDRVFNAPIVYVDIQGSLDEREKITIRRKLSATDLSKVSIRDLKPALEELGWVHHVNVKKVWPDVLIVRVIKQKAIAKWRTDKYLNGEGRVFSAELEIDPSVESRLPSLVGPPGAEKHVMSQFQHLNRALQKAGLSIRTLTLEDRGEWVLQLKNAVIVRLGKENISERMQRFIKIYEAVGLADKVTAIAEIDTRYPNGVAVSWKNDNCTDDCYGFAGNNNIKRRPTL